MKLASPGALDRAALHSRAGVWPDSDSPGSSESLVAAVVTYLKVHRQRSQDSGVIPTGR